MKTRIIEGIECFWCEQHRAWITEKGCRTNLNIAKESIETYLANGFFTFLNDIELDRIVTCSKCFRYDGIRKEEVEIMLESEMDNLREEFLKAYDEMKRQDEDYGESLRRARRAWYYKNKQRRNNL
jgi:hypothetical protein